MLNKEQKDLINKYKSEGKTVIEIYKIMNLTYNQVYRCYNIDKINERDKLYKETHKEENKEYQERYRKEHKKERKEYQEKYRENHKEERKEYDKLYRENHKEEKAKYYKKYYENNSDIIKERSKTFYENNKEERKEYDKLYRESHKEEITKRQRNYRNKRRKLDLEYKIACNLRCRIRLALHGKSKSAHTMELIGCSIEELKQHLESQFRDGMSWENYGTTWHIDHIIPCIAFDMTDEEQQKECFNYKNLQPLLVEENLSKNDTMPDGTRARYIKKVL